MAELSFCPDIIIVTAQVQLRLHIQGNCPMTDRYCEYCIHMGQ